MKAKLVIGTALAALAVLIPATGASAASSGTYWTWSPRYAASQVEGSILGWRNDADDYVTYAACRGIGRAHLERGVAQFYRLNCYVETADGEEYIIRIKANGKYSFKYRFLRFA